MAWKTQKDPVASCGRDSPARRIRGTILTARCMCWTVQSWSPSPGFISCWSVLIDVDATIMPHPNPRWIIVPLHCASAACDASTTLEMEIAWSLERDWDVTKLQKSAKVYQGLPRSTKVCQVAHFFWRSCWLLVCRSLLQEPRNSCRESAQCEHKWPHNIQNIVLHVYIYIWYIYICVCVWNILLRPPVKWWLAEASARFCPFLSFRSISVLRLVVPTALASEEVGEVLSPSLPSQQLFSDESTKSIKIIQDHSRSTMQLKHIETSNKTDTTNRRAAAVFGRATLAGHPRSLAWQPFDWATGDWISEILVMATAHGTPESGRNENIPDSFISIEIILVKIINLRWSQKHKVCLRLKPRTWQSLRL